MIKRHYVLLIISAYCTVLLIGVLAKQGIIIGGDWSIPLTEDQAYANLKQYSHNWVYFTPFGNHNSNLLALPMSSLIYLITTIGISGALISKFLLYLVFFFSGLSMYHLFQYLKCHQTISIFGSFFYITTPLFFNYSAMGWINVLIFMSVLPVSILLFIRSVNEHKFRYCIIVALLMSIAMIQSQSLLWFSITFGVFSIYLINDKKTFGMYVKSLALIFTAFIFINAYWILGLVLAPDRSLSGGDTVTSSVSLGTSIHLKPINILRMYGSIFNYQYESVMSKLDVSFIILSFIIPLLALLSLLAKERKMLILTLWVLCMIPFIMYMLNSSRELIANLPFANVIRDFARFSALSTFGIIVLSILSLDKIYKKDLRLFSINIVFIIIFIWAISLFPWSEIAEWEKTNNQDIRLRTKVFPRDYLVIEKSLSMLEDKTDKVIYIPYGGIVESSNDPAFQGSYKEIQDIFALYSPVPGPLFINDRNIGQKQILDSIYKSNLSDLAMLASITNIKYIVLRKDLVISNKEAIDKNIKKLNGQGIIKTIYKSENISLYFIASKKKIIYNPTYIGCNGSLDCYTKEGKKYYQINQKGRMQQEIESNNSRLWVDYQKIDQTKYLVNIYNAKGKFAIAFLEGFNNYWRIYPISYSNSNQTANGLFGTLFMNNLDVHHSRLDGYANVWLIDTDSLCNGNDLCRGSNSISDFSIIIEYWPQRWVYIGIMISGITLILLSVMMFMGKKSRGP